MSVDVAATRESQRRRRLRRLAVILGIVGAWMWWRILRGDPVQFGWPRVGSDLAIWLPGILIVLLLGAVLVIPMVGNSRSPHQVYMPEQIEVGFSDVKGLGPVIDEVQRTLDVFLNHKRFQEEMGGSPRRGVLFEGPPGTGKTHVAKALAKEAGVPFLYVSSTAFQSMWYGMTGRRIKAFFRALRRTARREGGAIGFIEEIDAIGVKRGGVTGTTSVDRQRMQSATVAEGAGGVVNELLIQMQSFDEVPLGLRLRNWWRDRLNRFLPFEHQLQRHGAPASNILVIGATNRADQLDPALLRPGRFDRVFHFDLPSRTARKELVDYFVERRAHDPALNRDAVRDDIAAQTMGYTPASLERLFDEALLVALRDGRGALTMPDIHRARMEVEIGLPRGADYPDEERRTIATHEAGHAVTAYLAGKARRLEVLSIIKRKDALGLLAHRDEYERFTRTKSEIQSLIQIAFGGLVAEELFFGEAGTGPAGDLSAATQLAVDMVGSFGMAGSYVSFRAIDGGIIGENLAARVLADDNGREAVDRILDEAKTRTASLLHRHRYLVMALRDSLLEREELLGREIIQVLEDAERAAVAGGEVVVDLRPDAPLLPLRRVELVDLDEGK